MKLYIVQRYIIFFFSKTVDENNCKLRTKRLSFAGSSIMEWKIFPKVGRILLLFTLMASVSTIHLSEYFITRVHETGGND